MINNSGRRWLNSRSQLHSSLIRCHLACHLCGCSNGRTLLVVTWHKPGRRLSGWFQTKVARKGSTTAREHTWGHRDNVQGTQRDPDITTCDGIQELFRSWAHGWRSCWCFHQQTVSASRFLSAVLGWLSCVDLCVRIYPEFSELSWLGQF